MAMLQHQPSLPPPSFLGRPEQRSATGPSLPAIHTLQAQHRERQSLHPIQLPPLQGSVAFSTQRSPTTSGRAVTHINNLLAPSLSPPAARPYPAPADPPAQRPGVGNYDRSAHETQAYTRSSYPPPVFAHHVPTSAPTPRPTYAAMPAPIRTQPQFASVNFTPEQSPAMTGQSPSSSMYDMSPRSSEPPRSSNPRDGMAQAGFLPVHRAVSQRPPFNYHLDIRQQPVAARACGFGERDRRVIDPPPILELKVTDPEGQPVQDEGAMLALSCTLMTPDGRTDDTEVQPTDGNTQATRRLMGTLVASPYQAKDEHGIAGTFFVFPDLSCRSPGRYRLRCKLIRIDPTNMLPGVTSPSVANTMTDVFAVFTAKDFPGMRASSALLKALRRQGLNVGVKKGSEARKGKGKTKKDNGSSDEDDESDESEDEPRGSTASGSTGGVSPRTKSGRKKKSKRKRRES